MQHEAAAGIDRPAEMHADIAAEPARRAMPSWASRSGKVREPTSRFTTSPMAPSALWAHMKITRAGKARIAHARHGDEQLAES